RKRARRPDRRRLGSAVASADRRLHHVFRQRLSSRPERSADNARRGRHADRRQFEKVGTMKRLAFALIAITTAVAFTGAQSEKLDYAAIGRIRAEGMNRSQVMDHISWLSDVYGPRLTGSPAIQQASEWAMKKFGEWGLANVHQER